MTSRIYDFCVIGAGIVGLATALTLLERRPGADILVLEKEDSVAFHQTGHNSGVIHAGIYYAPGSHKALMCKQGAQWTRDFCDAHGIPYRNTGKLIVATGPAEQERLLALHQRALTNELDVELIDGAELRNREPNIVGTGAIALASTGIVDFRQVCQAMAESIRDQGGTIELEAKVVGIEESPGSVEITFERAGDQHEIRAQKLVACGGIQADRLARMAGMDIDFAMVPFRGEYFQLRPELNNIVNTLIYPVPDPSMPFLGVHLTLMIDGSVTVGPNAVLGLAREGYPKLSVNRRDIADIVRHDGFWKLARGLLKTGISEQWDSLFKPGYLRRVRKYCPQLTMADLQPYPAGIRAQAVTKEGKMIEDFHFLQSDRMLHVANAPSPAATSAMPIAAHLADKVMAETA